MYIVRALVAASQSPLNRMAPLPEGGYPAGAERVLVLTVNQTLQLVYDLRDKVDASLLSAQISAALVWLIFVSVFTGIALSIDLYLTRRP